jgi:hypothetical protein
MKSHVIHPIGPEHESGPQTDKEEESTPELPEGERTYSADAAHWIFMGIALMCSTALFAQTTPTTPSTPQTSTAVPQTQQPNSTQGWTLFDSNVGTRLKLKDDQLDQLQEIDGRYRERYTGLGNMPWTNEGYAPLTEQRNKDIRNVLTPDQYNQWIRTYGGNSPDIAPVRPAGMTGTTTPPTGKP